MVEIHSLAHNHTLASGTVDMANPKLVIQGNSTGEILSRILETREKISVPDPLVERISFWPFNAQLLLNSDRVKTYDEKMPTFNQLCLIVSYMENIQMEPDVKGNSLWMNKCDEMMTEAHRFTWEDAHYSARLAKGPGHTARYIGLIGVLEAAMVVVEIYLNEGGLFSVPGDQLNMAISSIFDREIYKNIRQGRTRLIVSELVVERALTTVDLNQIVYKRLFAVDPKTIATRTSARIDETTEAKQLLKIGKFLLEYPSVFFSVSDLVEAISWLRRKNNYSKVSIVLKILETKDLLRKFVDGMHGFRNIATYDKVLPRNHDNVIQLLDFETKLAAYDLTLAEYLDSCKHIKTKLKGVLNQDTVLPLLQSPTYKALYLALPAHFTLLKEDCLTALPHAVQVMQEIQPTTSMPPTIAPPTATPTSSAAAHPTFNISLETDETMTVDQSSSEYCSLSTSTNIEQSDTAASNDDETATRIPDKRRKRSASSLSDSTSELPQKRVTRSAAKR